MGSRRHGPKLIIGCSEKANYLFDCYDIWNLV